MEILNLPFRPGLYARGALKPLTRCEVRIDGLWQAVEIDAVKQQTDVAMRCPSCHGALRLHGMFDGRGSPHFRHIRAHDGCPERMVRYSGTPSRHPAAIA